MTAYDVIVIREDRFRLDADDPDAALEEARDLGCTCPGGAGTCWHTEVRPVQP